MTRIRVVIDTARVCKEFAKLGRRVLRDPLFVQAGLALSQLEKLYDELWYVRYAEEICESQGEVEDVFV